MSYQVLARKWRPRTFREMVGQEHVLQALINALDHDRLHHAYLFTGTRGVGKTTIARILAKCLNCEVGVSSAPCNECSACTEINDGRFIDLIEVDAASRTKVEDTRELLDNVQYAPTRGRYKVYLIDEVHMLSNSSFNALLKTLEEPPPHVKFLLATTDPQKLPVTILSRCLQFNLKNMNPERIVSHLQFVLDKEMVPFEEAGVWQLARSADGSMRDALSLTDQAIAFGDGKVTEVDVRTMLGTIDQSLVYDVLSALMAENAQQLLAAVAGLSEHAPDYNAALAELIAVLHRIAIAQTLPEAVDNTQGDRQKIYHFAQNMAAEDVQLYYQTALLGRRDLPLVPDPRSGFEMVLLRMLVFKPQGVAQLPNKALTAQASEEPIREEVAGSDTRSVEDRTQEAQPTGEVSPSNEAAIAATSAYDNENPSSEVVDTVKKHELATVVAEDIKQEPVAAEPMSSPSLAKQRYQKPAKVTGASGKLALADLCSDNWFTVYSSVDASGLLQSTVANCYLESNQQEQLSFILDQQQSILYDEAHQQRLAELLGEYFEQSVQVSITIGLVAGETPAQIIVRREQERQAQAVTVITADPIVQQLQETFQATIVDGSISSIDSGN